ncbi:32147_t:CDS:1, partial [Gigaspora margarita]
YLFLLDLVDPCDASLVVPVDTVDTFSSLLRYLNWILKKFSEPKQSSNVLIT